MTLNKFVKKNKALLALAGIAIVTIGALLAVLFSQELPSSQLADDTVNSGRNASIAETNTFAQESRESEFQVQQSGFDPGPGSGIPGCPTAAEADVTGTNSDGTCQAGFSLCWSSAASQNYCYRLKEEAPEQGPTTCELNGGQCIGTGGISSCSDVGTNWAEGTGTCLNSQICCQELAPTTCSSLGGACASENACGQRNYQTSDCTSAGQICCIPDDLGADPPAEEDGGTSDPVGGQNTPGSQPGSPPNSQSPGSKKGFPPGDPSNFCSTQVTCGECNEECSSGSGKCQTCSTADNSCSYKLACSDDPNDPIFSNTCGKGEFTDDTHTKRVDGDPDYNHVACTGGSTCIGGPNTDGLYYCIDPGGDDGGIDPGEKMCQLSAIPTKVDKKTCSSECATMKKCSDGQTELGDCIPAANCSISGHIPSPTDEPEDPTDPANFPKVTYLSTNPKGTATVGEDNKITVEVRGEADKFSVYIHGTSEPKPGDQVIHGYNKNNLEGNKFYFLKDVSNKQKLTFDTPTQEGKYYIAVNAVNYGPSPGNAAGEIVCSWHEDAYQRDENGGIDINDRLGVCPNIVREINVEAAATSPSGGNERTSTPVSGLAVTARTSPNCGGHIEVYWTKGNGDDSNGYWLYRGDKGNFIPSPDNLIAGPIGAPRTSSNPYDDWLSQPGKTYYYKVIQSGKEGNTNSSSTYTTTSPACGN